MRISGFLLSYFLVYGVGLHGYAINRMRRAYRLSWKKVWLLIGCALILVALPIATRMTERVGHVSEARVLAYIGYGWMGLIFLFVVTIACCDGVRLICHFFRKMNHSAGGMFLTSRRVVVFSLAVSLLILCYGWFEAWDIRLKKVTLETDKFPPYVDHLRIVQISDVHLGLIVGQKRLEKITAIIREAEPDLLVATGDLIDGHLDGYADLVHQFDSIDPPLGKYAVTGNHEFYAGLSHSLNFLQSAGFEVLRNRAVNLKGVLTLAGMDDQAGRLLGEQGMIPTEEILRGADLSNLVILLKHRPVVDKDSMNFFDLQLSGHIHQGQIFPFGLVTKIFYPAPAGLSKIGEDSFLYVSRGTGTWGPPIRFLSSPEVTLLEIVRRQ